MSERGSNPRGGLYDRVDTQECIRQARLMRAAYARALLVRATRAIARIFAPSAESRGRRATISAPQADVLTSIRLGHHSAARRDIRNAGTADEASSEPPRRIFR
jgi:hypothetical protein